MQEQLGHDGSETGPSRNSWSQRAKTVRQTWSKLTSSSTGIVMVNPRNLETVVSQRQYFQDPVVVQVPRSREQNYEAFGVIKQGKMQEMTFVVRGPKKPDEPEERGRSTLVTAIQMEKGTIV